ncbi:uncharacterized protein LOC128657314 isoform X2 [Bombina bombina]|uniref:uncharacterized protein LOC128657314 isoform X2 n=1 Tax=Bombina bombina TaxID=8345 RepID=UPI00235AE442|nr:uncharacterized protein LOC128657314 isoform X2 [Bombina bombina]
MPRCFVIGCPTKQMKGKKTGDISLHCFPISPIRIRAWIQSTGQAVEDMDLLVEKVIETKKNSIFRMCSKHFREKDYEMIGVRKCLKKDAVPSRFDRPSTNPDILNINEPQSTESIQPPPKKKREYSFKTRHTSTHGLIKSRSIGTWTGLLSEVFEELSVELQTMRNYNTTAQEKTCNVINSSLKVPDIQPTCTSAPRTSKPRTSSVPSPITRSQCYTTSLTMNKMKKKLPEQILNHILEILYLLTGERVTNLLTVSHMTGDKMTTEKILTHTLQIMYLLTGEEWEYIEGLKELYKDVMMETHQALRTMEIPENESSGDSDDNLDTGAAELVQNIQPEEAPSDVSDEGYTDIVKVEITEDLCVTRQLGTPNEETNDSISSGDVKTEVTLNTEQTNDLYVKRQLKAVKQENSGNIRTGDVKTEVTLNAEHTNDLYVKSQMEDVTQEISDNISTWRMDVTPSDGSAVELRGEQYVCDQVKTEEDEVPINTATGEFTNYSNPSHGQTTDTSFNLLQYQKSHVGNLF